MHARHVTQTVRGADASGQACTHTVISCPTLHVVNMTDCTTRSAGTMVNSSATTTFLFSPHRPVRQANEQFAAEHRMEKHFSNSSVGAAAVGAAACI